MTATTDRRTFLKHSGVAAAALSLKYMVPGEAMAAAAQPVYGVWEDLMRKKWTLCLQRLRQERHRLARRAAGRVRPLR